MKVYELKVKVKLAKDIHYEQMVEKTNYYIDKVFLNKQEYCEYHQGKEYKGYVHDLLYPIEKDGIYKHGKIYTMRVRTIDDNLAKYFMSELSFNETKELKGLGCEIRIVPKRIIQSLYSITPIIIKNPGLGYWRNHMSLDEFESRLKNNLIKKYKYFTGIDLGSDLVLYDLIEFKNKVPVKMAYKNIHLLGDKVNLEIAQNQVAQDLAYFILGVGIGEGSSRSMGFMSAKYM